MTRSELYELIWSQPMTEIARFYGVPAMKVAQACDAYEIARPPAGYWQKLAHGKAPERFALANRNYAADEIVTIEDRKNGSLVPAGNVVSTERFVSFGQQTNIGESQMATGFAAGQRGREHDETHGGADAH